MQDYLNFNMAKQFALKMKAMVISAKIMLISHSNQEEQEEPIT